VQAQPQRLIIPPENYLFEISPADLFIFLVEKGVFWMGITTTRVVETVGVSPRRQSHHVVISFGNSFYLYTPFTLLSLNIPQKMNRHV